MSEATGMLGDEIVPLFEMGLPEHQVGLVQPRESWSQISWTDWTPPNDLENYGYYEIALTGVVSLPAPGGLALLGLALIGPRRRRR
jgi:MYXO-CTERM domain-containing protein